MITAAVTFRRHNPYNATVYVRVEDGPAVEVAFKRAWSAWGLNRWLQHEVYKTYRILKEASPAMGVVIREEKDDLDS